MFKSKIFLTILMSLMGLAPLAPSTEAAEAVTHIRHHIERCTVVLSSAEDEIVIHAVARVQYQLTISVNNPEPEQAVVKVIYKEHPSAELITDDIIIDAHASAHRTYTIRPDSQITIDPEEVPSNLIVDLITTVSPMQPALPPTSNHE